MLQTATVQRNGCLTKETIVSILNLVESHKIAYRKEVRRMIKTRMTEMEYPTAELRTEKQG